MQAFVIGIIVIIISAFVGGVISVIAYEKHHTFMKAVITGIAVGFIVFFITGGTPGRLNKDEGSEIEPDKIIEEEVDLEATEIILEYKNNKEQNTFDIILDGIKIDTGQNWLQNLKDRIKQYNNLDVLKVKNTGDVQADIVKDLDELKDEFDIDLSYDGTE